MNFGRNVGSRLAIAAFAALGLIAATATQGCTVTTSEPNTDGGLSGTDAEPHDGGKDSSTAQICAACYAPQCSTQGASCTGDAECKAIRDCAVASNRTADAIHACIDAHPAASRYAYYAAGACQTSAICGTCASSCASAQSVCVDAGQTVCQQCLGVVCSQEQKACAAADCATYQACVHAAQDPTALAKCGGDHPAAKAANDKLLACTPTCKNECSTN